MVYRIQVDWIGQTGASCGCLVLHETDTEMKAIALAAYEVDISGPTDCRIATVFDPSGLLVLTYVGRASAVSDDDR